MYNMCNINDVNNLTDVLLQAPNAKRLSFESCYRIMYNYQLAITTTKNDHNLVQAIKYFKNKFRKGQWNKRSNWGFLRDCWMYPLRTSEYGHLALNTMNSILAYINCYPALLKLIYAKYKLYLNHDLCNLINQYVGI